MAPSTMTCLFSFLLLLVSLIVAQALVTPVLRTHPTSATARGFNNFFKKPEPVEEKAPPEPEFQDGAYDEDDPVEKIFSFFFGKREEAPLGLCK